MSTQVTVALLQLRSYGRDQGANLAAGEAACRRAAAGGADIALFPEMWNIGYTFPDAADPEDCARWAREAVGADAAFVRHFRALARELGMAIALTYLEEWPERPRNAVTLIDRHGEDVLTYAKVHTCAFDAEAALTPGDAFSVVALDTARGPVRVGAMICFDREFPESARLLMLGGAEIILAPNACEMESNRLAQLRTRAYENMLGIALANYAAPRCNGHSVAFDGIAFVGEEGITRDHCILEAGEEEGIFLATFDLERMRAYRETEVWGNAYRRPRCYRSLMDETVESPFVRDDAVR
jgi:N-carbamoylputrescine amidase